MSNLPRHRIEGLSLTAAAIQAQDLSKSQCTADLPAALNILDKWKVSCEQACQVLRISRSTYNRASQKHSAPAVSLDADQMQRISLVLNIHAVLRLVFDDPDNDYGFPSMENRNEFFNGRTPLEIMVQGDMVTLYEPFRQIDAQWSTQGDAERSPHLGRWKPAGLLLGQFHAFPPTKTTNCYPQQAKTGHIRTLNCLLTIRLAKQAGSEHLFEDCQQLYLR
ncbi:hypothetical protein SAMN05216363_2147 [Pseudomonas sihuiensis]|uniref:Antitoxin Xre-like helix-turn-helix domain-containing protein n=1 Tax=Pseudomonas sihuiensis TaxID=1274359 RepID=A0A1H2LSL9_9PSED|nr:hypothetical protein SAMN05216363_2147 [Pseudomonas sihuiensis]